MTDWKVGDLVAYEGEVGFMRTVIIAPIAKVNPKTITLKNQERFRISDHKLLGHYNKYIRKPTQADLDEVRLRRKRTLLYRRLHQITPASFTEDQIDRINEALNEIGV